MTHCGYWTASDGTYGREDGEPYPPDLRQALEKFGGDQSKLVANYVRWSADVEKLEARLSFASPEEADNARAEADRARRELVAWHREDIDERLGVVPIRNAVDGLETYQFTLVDRPVAGVEFSAEPKLGQARGLDTMRAAASDVIERTRSSALLQARRDLVAQLAADRAQTTSRSI